MNPPDQHKSEALSAIHALRYAAARGDTEAAAGLLAVASYAVDQLEAIAAMPAGHPIGDAMNRLAGVSDRWPVNIPATEERRLQAICGALPPWFGLTGPIRTTANRTGRPRDFNPHSRTGFTAGIIAILRNEGKFPHGENIDAIKAACMAQLEHDCAGDWKNFPWPPDAVAEAERENHRSNPIRHVLQKWVSDGLKSLSW